MIDIKTHPVWKGVHPIKKPLHLLRIFLARNFAKTIPLDKLIGISGSVGKTTTTLASLAVLSQKYKAIATKDSLDMIFNLPITILKVSPKTQKVILEMGIEYPGEMDFYLNLVRPKTAILTNISKQHSQFLGDEQNIAREKMKLIEQLPEEGVAILNWDDPHTRAMAEKTKAKVIFFGKDKDHCDVWASGIKINDFNMTFGLNYGVESVQINSKLLGLHQVYPLLAASALGISADIPLVKIKRGLETVNPAPHRLQALEGYNGSIILDDTYNAAPVAVEEALDTLSRVPARRRIVVLGEMRELGEFSEAMHRQVARKIYQEKPDLVLLGQGEARIIADELIKLGFIPERLELNLKNSEIISKLLQILSKGDVVLVKGARALRLDEVVAKLVSIKK